MNSATVGALLALAGLALIYWSLSGFGIIEGSTPDERYKNLTTKLKTKGTSNG